jgi:ribosomal protein S27E
MDWEHRMIEQDMNDSFPEDAFVSWECPDCGHRQQVMLRFIEAALCTECVEALVDGTDADWLDVIDKVERGVA